MSIELFLPDWLELFDNNFGNVFVLLTSEDVTPFVKIQDNEQFYSVHISVPVNMTQDALVNILNLSRTKSLGVSVLYFATCEYNHLSLFNDDTIKIACISFFSSVLSLNNITKQICMSLQTNYRDQIQKEDALLEVLDKSSSLSFESGAGRFSLEFKHKEATNWFSLNGPIDFSHQCVLPTGELSVLADQSGQFSWGSVLKLNGEILISGLPVVHRGDKKVMLNRALDKFEQLATMYSSKAVLQILDGIIHYCHPFNPLDALFSNAFLSLLESDERYRKIQEIGFGMNYQIKKLVHRNFFPNERFPAIHLGIGLGGFTEFHIDLICPEVAIVPIY